MSEAKDLELVYTWNAWECPQCGGSNDYAATHVVGQNEHECIHCSTECYVEIGSE